MGFKNLEYGFTHIVIDKVERPYCLNCNGLYSNDWCKPGRLKNHLKNQHKDSKDKTLLDYEIKERAHKKRKEAFKKVKIIPEEKFICCLYTISH